MKWLLTRLQYVWRRHGISGLTPLLIRNIAYYARHLRNYAFGKGKVVDPFDQQYGVETSSLASLSSLDMLQHPDAVYAGPYAPSSVPQVRTLIEKLDIEIDRFIFIDFGSGKGECCSWPPSSRSGKLSAWSSRGNCMRLPFATSPDFQRISFIVVPLEAFWTMPQLLFCRPRIWYVISTIHLNRRS